jgi:hypothetical protein
MRFVPAANIERGVLDEGLDIFGRCLDRFAAGA